jgi:phosphomannomutase/phosphoglucomutase
MPAIPAKIFKKYDIRGTASGAAAVVTPQVAHLIGQAVGTYAQRHEHQHVLVIGRDNRHSSPDLAAAVAEGAAQTGITVVDIGLVSTPLVYWHAVQRGAAGLMVTGSHLAPDQNGFKLSIGARNLFGDTLQLLRELIERGDFAYGSGHVEVDSASYSHYLRDMSVRVPKQRSLRVVIDTGNGTGGLFAPTLFQAWGHEVVECLFAQPDGDYPNHQPDPQEPANMAALAARVRETGADVGIAFDGDADRMGAVDENGQIIVADRILALLAQDMLKRHPGAAVVADVLSSQVLFDAVAAAGGQPMMWISGHSLIKAKMTEIGALLGGEMSGHIFLAEDYYGCDDAYLAAGRLLALIAAGDVPLSALNAALPTLFSTPEYRPRCPDDRKAVVIDAVKNALTGAGEIVDVDGVRVLFERGWGLLRASNTEPVLSLRFEGQTEADALAYRDRFFAVLRQFPEVELKA